MLLARLLLTACCLLLAPCCLLPAACCLLLAACCLLPLTYTYDLLQQTIICQGSGKSRAARLLREAEALHAGGGGVAVRVIALNDYFMGEDADGEMVYRWEDGCSDDWDIEVALVVGSESSGCREGLG